MSPARSSSKPSAARAVREAPASAAPRASCGGARGDHLVDPGVDPRPELLPVEHQTHQGRRVAHPRRPELLAVAQGVESRPLKLERPCDALSVARVDRCGARPGPARRASPPGHDRRSLARPRPARLRALAGAARGPPAPPAGTGRFRRRRSGDAPRRGAASISAWARAANRPALNSSLGSTKPTRRCSSRARSVESPRRSVSRGLGRPGSRHRRSPPAPPRALAAAPRPRPRPPSFRPRWGRRSPARPRAAAKAA